MDTNGGQWLTIKAAAEALGQSERTIRRKATQGKLPADRSGRLILVDIAGHVRETGPAAAATVTDTDGQLAAMATEIEALRSERDALQGEATRLSEVLAEVRSERDYLRQVHALAVSGEPTLLTEGEGRPRRRWWPPWQREG